MAADGVLSFSVRRMLPLPFEEKALRSLLVAEWPDAREIAVADHPVLSARTTYPSRKFEFLTGQNEDTRYHHGIVVYRDDWTFHFALALPVDNLHPHDDSGPSQAGLESMLVNLDFLAFDAPPCLNAAKVYADTGLLADNTVMTALLRIKREANPEAGLEAHRGRLAYRYDGVTMISAHGLAVHRFAFGTDLPEKFTAERHFGVGKDGTVYEMNIRAGGQYRELKGQRHSAETKVPAWWGDYVDGARSVHIGSYREGPEHFYIEFSLLDGGREVGNGIAIVEERKAFYCGLSFSLTEDDDTLAIVLDDDATLCGEDWLPDFIGSYRRAELGITKK